MIAELIGAAITIGKLCISAAQQQDQLEAARHAKIEAEIAYQNKYSMQNHYLNNFVSKIKSLADIIETDQFGSEFNSQNPVSSELLNQTLLDLYNLYANRVDWIPKNFADAERLYRGCFVDNSLTLAVPSLFSGDLVREIISARDLIPDIGNQDISSTNTNGPIPDLTQNDIDSIRQILTSIIEVSVIQIERWGYWKKSGVNYDSIGQFSVVYDPMPQSKKAPLVIYNDYIQAIFKLQAAYQTRWNALQPSMQKFYYPETYAGKTPFGVDSFYGGTPDALLPKITVGMLGFSTAGALTSYLDSKYPPINQDYTNRVNAYNAFISIFNDLSNVDMETGEMKSDITASNALSVATANNTKTAVLPVGIGALLLGGLH